MKDTFQHLQSGSIFQVIRTGHEVGRPQQLFIKCVWAATRSGDQTGTEFWVSLQNFRMQTRSVE